MIKIIIKTFFRVLLFIAISWAFPLVWLGAWVSENDMTIKEAFLKTKKEYLGFFDHIFNKKKGETIV